MKVFRKKLISLLCAGAMLMTSISGVFAYDFTNTGEVVYVQRNENGFEFVSPSAAMIANVDQSIVQLERVSERIYAPVEGETLVPTEFRIVSESDGTLHATHAVSVDLNSSNPCEELIADYGFNMTDVLIQDINAMASDPATQVESITVYTIPKANTYSFDDPIPSYKDGKLIHTRITEVKGNNTDRGQNIAECGKNGLTSASAIDEIEVTLSEYRTRTLSMTLLKFFGKTLMNKIIDDWSNPANGTNPYIAEYTSYVNYVKYTSVVENNVEYLGCISNSIDAACQLTYYGVGSNAEIKSLNKMNDTIESDSYANADEVAVDNYISNTVDDRIGTLFVHVSYPNGRNAVYAESIVSHE